MRDVDVDSDHGPGVPRTRSMRGTKPANADGAADSVTLTRSGTGVDLQDLGLRKQDRRQVKGETAVKALSLNQQLQRQKAAALEAASAAAALETKVLTAETELKSTRQALEVEKEAGMRDAARTAVRLSLLEEELAVVAMRAMADRGELSKERNLWRGAATITGLIAVIFLCVAGWQMTLPGVVKKAPVATGGPAVPMVTGNRRVLPADPDAALTMGIDLLNAALAGVPGKSAEQALRIVSKKGEDCAMVWTDDVPSLLFAGKMQNRAQDPRRMNELANTLADCAEAVSKLY
jgi:hypothetical protein